MNEEQIIKISIKFRRSLYKEWVKFFNKNKMSNKDAFLINSHVISSLMAQIVHAMFKKGDPSVSIHRESYIDEICEL